MATARLQVVEREGAREAAGKALYDAIPRELYADASATDVPRSALPWEMLTAAEAEAWCARAWAAVEAYVEHTVEAHGS